MGGEGASDHCLVWASRLGGSSGKATVSILRVQDLRFGIIMGSLKGLRIRVYG